MDAPTVLDAGQLLLIGFIASLLAQGVKLALAQFGKDIHRGWLTGIAFVISVGLAYWWFPVEVLIVPDDPMATAVALATAASAVLGSATLIYNVLVQKIFEKLDWTKERLLPPG